VCNFACRLTILIVKQLYVRITETGVTNKYPPSVGKTVVNIKRIGNKRIYLRLSRSSVCQYEVQIDANGSNVQMVHFSDFRINVWDLACLNTKQALQDHCCVVNLLWILFHTETGASLCVAVAVGVAVGVMFGLSFLLMGHFFIRRRWDMQTICDCGTLYCNKDSSCVAAFYSQERDAEVGLRFCSSSLIGTNLSPWRIIM